MVHADSNSVVDIYNSNGACQTQCQGQYAFAIVQWQSCWCSNYVPADQTSTGDCSQQCPGYPDESCGSEDDGLYGYIALNRAPSGTMGASSETQQTSTAYVSSASSSPHPTLLWTLRLVQRRRIQHRRYFDVMRSIALIQGSN